MRCHQTPNSQTILWTKTWLKKFAHTAPINKRTMTRSGTPLVVSILASLLPVLLFLHLQNCPQIPRRTIAHFSFLHIFNSSFLLSTKLLSYFSTIASANHCSIFLFLFSYFQIHRSFSLERPFAKWQGFIIRRVHVTKSWTRVLFLDAVR